MLKPIIFWAIFLGNFAQGQQRKSPSLHFTYPVNTDPYNLESFPSIQTSSVRFTLEVRDLDFPEMHFVEVELWRPIPNPDRKPTDGPDIPLNIEDTLMITSKMIVPRSDAPDLEDEMYKLIEARKVAERERKKPDRDTVMNAIVEMTGSDPSDFESELEEILSPVKPHKVEFIARGLPDGRYGLTASIKRREIQSNVGLILPPLNEASPGLRTSQTFFVKSQVISVTITHMNHVAVTQKGQSSNHPVYSSQSSIVLNYTAAGSTDGTEFKIPEDGSLSVAVDGQPWRGPILAPPDGKSVVLGMLSDGLHLVELSPVDSVEGEPVPESQEGKAELWVEVNAPRTKVEILSPKPNDILDSDSDLWLSIKVRQGEQAEGGPWIVGRDGYVRVQVNNNTEERTFSHGGPYKISNLDTGVHTLEVLLLDSNFMPLADNHGEVSIDIVRFAYMVTEEEKKRRRKIEALQGEAMKQALAGNSESAANMIDVARRQRGPDAPGGRDADGRSVADLETVAQVPLLSDTTTIREERWSGDSMPPNGI